MTRAAKGRVAWAAVFGLAAILVAAELPALASPSAPGSSYVQAHDITGIRTASQQVYTYDNYANLTAVTGAGAVNIPASLTTNRLTGIVSYDAAGNLTSWNNNLYDVDAFGMMWRYRPAGQGVEHVHIYTADDERLWTYSPGSPSRWTLRALDGRVLREFSNNAGTWSVHKDYVYRGSTLVSAVQADGQTHHLHPDHLGTPRLITNAAGVTLAYHVYYPYGVELSPIAQDGERLKFTGHERDLGVSWSNADDLDYMHARFYNPQVGRFMSVDPGKDWDPARPQAWNLYSYARNNPVNYVDPDGQVVKPPPADAPWWKRLAFEMAKDPTSSIGPAAMVAGPAKLGVAVLARGAAVARGRVAGVLQQKLLKDLTRSATAAGEDGLSAITRAIQKHSAREVTAFSPVTGKLAAKNATGKAIADEIIGNPATTFTQRTTGRFGEVLDVVAPDGRGLRFGSDGQFIGLLEPPL